MSRLKQLFEQKSENILNIYCTAGYPALNSTIPVMKALQESGADIIELGIPYSDPLADGETIQNSSVVALRNGMTIAGLFEQLQTMRTRISIPVILMGNINPVLLYGFERFCKDAATVGVDGLIIPDLPPYEFEITYKTVVEKYGLDFIFLVTPETSEERVRRLDALSSGFLYAVSSSSTTGRDKDFSAVEKYLERLKSYQLKNPILVGFGIKDHETFSRAARHSNGAIIGSAFIKALEGQADVAAVSRNFVKAVLN
ncbi:tryptophan synthase subunit alpha [Niabella ginsenosidivorans]|uniref:Tryptophan synthase alpha chain n=1 Tax=Niabella ginsenosidivorans TaxID=1176587 RepID=A0A1A9HYF3_9BACT|nr:tryptophan synthase subunit alpha [Niabella ginsenosidivorans]ANH79849.1 tryptophan synthase subunit alpha [Niabella ginsenosidivorans]